MLKSNLGDRGFRGHNKGGMCEPIIKLGNILCVSTLAIIVSLTKKEAILERTL